MSKLVDFMTPGHILFGSDYPHPEGMADPLAWAREIDELFPAADVQKMMGANMYHSSGSPESRPPGEPG